ncbi:MAG: hypothetical protein AUG44_12275 [Actinobacteria bacterium 13_1_20CM_3_71_11]|nr:MAG: hypothetical protein AUG44_12275 [Actinobacteria bacterium 13_1_20CM_3_71_11]
MDEKRWRRERDRAVEVHATALERQRATELARARELVARFAAQARERGLRTSPLTARPYHGRGRYRTGLRGWYLRPDGVLAVSEDGEFYVLTVPASVRARFTGVSPRPEEPRLVIGEGARDGERVALDELLRLRLAAGDDWPPAPGARGAPPVSRA